MFPPSYCFILSKKNGFALDVYDGQTKEDANVIVWPQKFQDSDNQLWIFDNGRIVNKKSGLVLDVKSPPFTKDKIAVQRKRKESSHTQEWIFENGFICSKVYPSMVLDIKGDSDKGGAQVILYKRKETDNTNQQWTLESYSGIEVAMNLAATSEPLHKKPEFGQPRLGYGAEIGVPPALKSLPANIRVAGVNGYANVAPTPIHTGQSSHDLLKRTSASQYGNLVSSPTSAQTPTSPHSAYPGPPPATTTAYPPAPPTNSYPSNYPPAPPARPSVSYPSNDGYPPAQQQPGGAYPPAHQSAGGYPPPQQPGGGYPPSQQPGGGYPPSQQPSGGYPPQPSQQTSGGGYPPSQGAGTGGYPYPQPSSATGYPPQPQQPSGGYGYEGSMPPYPTSPTYPPYPTPQAPPSQQQQQQQQQGPGGYGGYPPPSQNYPPYPPYPPQ